MLRIALLLLVAIAAGWAVDLAPLRAQPQPDLYYGELPAAITALIGGSEATSDLIAAFLAERDPIIQFDLIIILGHRLSRQPALPAEERAAVVEALVRALAHQHPWVRVEAVYQLGLTRDRQHLDAIRGCYDDASDFVFLHAVIAGRAILGRIDPTSTPEQLKRLQDAIPKLGNSAAAKRELDALIGREVF